MNMEQWISKHFNLTKWQREQIQRHHEKNRILGDQVKLPQRRPRINYNRFKHYKKLDNDPVNQERYVAYLQRRKIYDLGSKALARRLGVMTWLQKCWLND